MKSHLNQMSAALVGCLFATFATASAESYEVDKGKSKIEIAAKATGHEFGGSLKDFKINASGDTATLKPTALDFSWNFKDLDTADAKRDAEMIKWLGGGNPQGSYKFVKVWSKNGVDYAEGTLTINGVSKTVHIPITVKKDGDSITTSGKLVIDYKDFGLPLIRAMLVMTVEPEVTVSFTLVGKAK